MATRLLMLAALLGGLAWPATAQDADQVDVCNVSGLVDTMYTEDGPLSVTAPVSLPAG